jgi:outer membrane protein assembly factor BamB
MPRLAVAVAAACAVLSASACGSRSELLGELGGEVGLGGGDHGKGTLPDGAPDDDAAGLDSSTDGSSAEGGVNPCGGYQAYAPWPAFQRCSGHVGRSDAIGPTAPSIKWSSLVGRPVGEEQGVLGPPTIAADGTIYIADLYGEIVAMNPDGTTQWTAHPTFVQVGPSAVAVGSDGSLYVELDLLYALSSQGSTIWTAPIHPGVGSDHLGPTTSSIDTAGIIYTGNLSGQMNAWQNGGTSLWTFYVAGPDGGGSDAWIQAAPVIGDDGTLYFGATSGFFAFDPSGGAVKWQVPWSTKPQPGSGASAAIGPDETVYIASPDFTLRSVTPKGVVNWALVIGTPGSPPVVDGNGSIYILANATADAGEDQTLFAVTAKGAIAWTLPLPGVYQGGLAFGSDGTLYVAGFPNDMLYAIH